MGLTDFTRRIARMYHHGYHRVRPDPRASCRGSADLSAPPAGHRGRSLADRTTPRLQARLSNPRGDRVRASRHRSRDRSQGDPSRPQRAEKRGYQGSSLSCPHCQEAAKFVNYRPKTLVSLLGEVQLEGAYYHCPHCHAGFVPWDETLRLSTDALTPGASEVVCLTGIVSSFAEGSVIALPKLTVLHTSESTVERTTKAVGQDVGARLASDEVFGPSRDWDWHKDAEGKTCAYVSLDATGVCQQGPKGAKAEGRMVTVAMVYNPVPEAQERRARP